MSVPGIIPYVDTSALAKWYLKEPLSEAVEAYLRSLPFAAISSLTTVEMRCLLARRRRYRQITTEHEMQCHGLFLEDISRGHLHVVTLEDSHTQAALRLMHLLPGHSLRTLDALHLAIARSAGFEIVATADRIMAQAAAALGLNVQSFLGSPNEQPPS